MKIVIIGSGNVATHIANALHSVNMEIVQVWSYHYQNASILAAQVDAKAIRDLTEVDQFADLCLIAVKDDAIQSIADQLKDFKGLIVHTSGAVNMDIFESRFEQYGVFYPLQTFSKNKDLDFSTIPLCVEANTNQVLEKLKTLAGKLSRSVLEVSTEKRRILHVAAVFACNFTNHLYALAGEILTNHQLEFDILRPLILETASKVQQAMPMEVQTGPAIRNDEETIRKHTTLLQEQPQLLEIYKTLSESIKKIR
jgi:predicted short-subunit dehydrogenase-like oxidoreductase (DUF2520 family)